MDLVFCGTPLFAVPTLERLVTAGFRVQLVVTQPDRASGRGMELAASPVKRAALELRTSHRSARQDQEQRRIPRPSGKYRAGSDHRRRLWPHHSAMDDRSAEARQHQPARIAAAEVSRRRAHSMGDRQWRIHYRRDHHAHRCRPRYRRHSVASRRAYPAGRHRAHAGAAAGTHAARS